MKIQKLLNMAIEIVDIPIENGDFPSLFVCLPGRVLVTYGDEYPRVKHGNAEMPHPAAPGGDRHTPRRSPHLAEPCGTLEGFGVFSQRLYRGGE
jgi:hypothetical protein